MLDLSDCLRSNGIECMAGIGAMGQERWVGFRGYESPAAERIISGRNRVGPYQILLTAQAHHSSFSRFFLNMHRDLSVVKWSVKYFIYLVYVMHGAFYSPINIWYYFLR